MVWDLEIGGITELDDTDKGWITALDISPDGKTLATANRNVTFWDIQSDQSKGKLVLEKPQQLFDLAYSPDGKTLAVSGIKFVQLWDVDKKKLV